MRIIGIDPGSYVSGYALIKEEANSLLLEGGGIVKAPKKLDKYGRLLYLYKQVNEIIKKNKPEYAAIEDSFYHKNVKTSLYLGQVKGVLILAFVINRCKIYEFSPLEIKKAVVGYGQASKEQVEYMVKRLLNVNTQINYSDYYDAIAAAICLSNMLSKNSSKFLIRNNLLKDK